ncbi:MAG TPA: hypothetical protein VFW14_14585 [Gaiellales bacterium]|nr:hypothetical protein [Gaiellales bacterium]
MIFTSVTLLRATSLYVVNAATALADAPEHAYQFGLQVILDGLATQLPASDKL